MLKNKKIGIGITGSFCSMKPLLLFLKELNDHGVDLYVFLTDEVLNYDTRFFKHQHLISQIKEYTKHPLITHIVDAEPFGPVIQLDLMIVYPCSGNTLAKLTHGINDNAVTMAVKATLRNNRNVVIGLCSNDALSTSGVNFMQLMNTKHFYFMPMYQDDTIKKPNSLLTEYTLGIQTIVNALNDHQIQPIFITHKRER